MERSGAVFLDRDGVINEHVVNRAEEFELFPWTAKAIKRLNELGWRVFVVTNQGGVGLGYMTEQALQEVHAKMEQELAKEGATLVEVSACIHVPHAGCACRKPEPGMLLALADKYGIDLPGSFMIGDRDVDIQAGKKAGARTILVGGATSTLADYTAENLGEAVRLIEQVTG